MKNKPLRYALYAVLAVIIVLMVLSAGLWYILHQRQHILTQQAVSVLNKQFTGKLVVSDSRLSLFKQFPYISIDLRGVRFFSSRDTASVPLYAFQDVYVGFSIQDIWDGVYRIKRLSLEDGHIDIVKFSDGSINILNAKGINTSDNTDDSAAVSFDMNRLALKRVRCAYHDHAAERDVIAAIEELNASFSLHPDSIIAQLSTSLILDVDQQGEHTFFNTKHLTLSTQLAYSKHDGTIRLGATTLGLEKARFLVEGSLNTNDSMNIAMRFSGDKPSLTTFAAFAPPTVAEALERYKNEGRITFAGSVNGKLLGEQMPAYRVEFGCENASVVNTDVNKKVESIYFSGMITNGDGCSMKTSEFRLRNIRATPEVGIFRGDIVIRNFDDPYVNVAVNADIDLEFLAEFLGIEGLRRLKGQILLDMNFNELIDLDKPDATLLRLKEGIDSELTIKNLTVLVPNYPHPITNINGHAVMKKGAITMDDLSFTIADSDIHFDGTLSNVPALLHAQHEPLQITLNATARRINLKQLAGADSALARRLDEEITGLSVNLAFDTFADELRRFNTLPRGEFFIKNITARFKNYPHHLHDVRADILVDDRTLTVKDVSGVVDGSDVHLTASMDNYQKWLEPVKRGESSLRWSLRSERFSLKDILSYNGRNYVPEQYRGEEFRNIVFVGALTARFDSAFRSLHATIDKMNGDFMLHKVQLRNGKARIHYENNIVYLDTLAVRLGASDLAMSGMFTVDAHSFTGQARSNALKSTLAAPITLAVSSTMLDISELLSVKQNALRIARSAPASVSAKNGSMQTNNANTVNERHGSEHNGHSDAARDVNPSHAKAFNIFNLPFPNARIAARVGTLKLRSFQVNNLWLALRADSNHVCSVDTMEVNIAGGALALTGTLNASNPQDIRLETSIKATNIDLSKLLLKVDNFGQDSLISEKLTGKASGNVRGTIVLHPDLTPIVSKSEATLDIMVKQGELLNFAPLQALTRFFRDKNLNRVRFDTLRNTFTLRNGVLTAPAMTINSSLGYLELSGEQNIQRSSGFAMDYVVGVPFGMVTQTVFSMLFGGASRDTIAQNRIDEIQYRPADRNELLIKMRVQGTPGQYKITPGGK